MNNVFSSGSPTGIAFAFSVRLLGKLRTNLKSTFILGLLLILTLAGCNGNQEIIAPSDIDSAVEPANIDEIIAPSDINALTYRMYYDGFDDETENQLQIRQFTGQLWLADIEGIFGSIDALPVDENGNHVGAQITDDGTIWNLLASSSQAGLILFTRGLDGTFSSASDLDGDRVADIVDIWLRDGRRLSFVTEGLGMGIFERWLLGENPLCNSPLAQELGLEGFECGNEEENGAESSAGGGSGPFMGSGYVDPLDLICAGYGPSRGFSSQVRGERWRDIYQEVRTFGEGDSATSRTQNTGIFEDEEGQHLYTVKYTYEYDSDGRLIQTTHEFVNSNGDGFRQVWGKRADGSYTTSSEDFEAHLDENGDYNSDASDPPPPVPDPGSDAPPEEPPEEPPPAPDAPNPGPDGDDTSIADFCNRRSNSTSGVEQAAATDPTAFQLGCNDLVGAPASGGDCSIFQWARPGDFLGALEPGEDDGCDDFYERGQDGDCEPTTALETLRGRTALVASADFEFISLCSLLVCGPNPVEAADVEAADIQEISSTGVAPGPIVTETFTPTPDGPASITTMTTTPCYNGPGPQYGQHSSLAAGTTTQLIGAGFTGDGNDDWIVSEHPTAANTNCWVPSEDIETNIPFDQMRLITVPGLPTPTPQPTSDRPAPEDTAIPCYYDQNNALICP